VLKVSRSRISERLARVEFFFSGGCFHPSWNVVLVFGSFCFSFVEKNTPPPFLLFSFQHPKLPLLISPNSVFDDFLVGIESFSLHPTWSTPPFA